MSAPAATSAVPVRDAHVHVVVTFRAADTGAKLAALVAVLGDLVRATRLEDGASYYARVLLRRV